ncbi:hypothetical protein C2S51_022086 [Perilla frutescens var. frutescens]|nr:hypothetical protein C2S51_022086 [Perilla frutescens var. frutescens]
MKQCSYLISKAFVFTFLITIETTSGKSLINSTCLDIAQDDPNIDYSFCTTSLQAAPASHCSTLQGLATISMKLLRYNITDTRCFIKHLIKKNRASDPYLRVCLSDCFELFSDAIPSVKQAMRDYAKKRLDDANVEISSIMDGATTCEEGFKEKRGVVSPLTERNNHTFQLSAMALSILHIIQELATPSL